MMTIIKTHAITAGEDLRDFITSLIENRLAKYGDKITKAEVHLADENGSKGGDSDKRCLIEVHAAGLEPVVVKEYAHTVADALNGATQKLDAALESRIGKMKEHR